ncbi:hypothetical protein B0H14DRAFT_2640107 [Mycena olivaceomarginata]|nr:hypothetical protein B0H14DRAFT_2640107 [Mycena olivaceomarginata]
MSRAFTSAGFAPPRRASSWGLLGPRTLLLDFISSRRVAEGHGKTEDVRSQFLHRGALCVAAHLAGPRAGVFPVSVLLRANWQSSQLAPTRCRAWDNARADTPRQRSWIRSDRPPVHIFRTTRSESLSSSAATTYFYDTRTDTYTNPTGAGRCARVCASHGHQDPVPGELPVSATLHEMLPQRARAQMVHPAIYATALAAARSMRRTGGKVYYSDGMAALRPRQPTRKDDVAYKRPAHSEPQGTRQQSCKCAHMSEDERRLGAYEFQAKAQTLHRPKCGREENHDIFPVRSRGIPANLTRTGELQATDVDIYASQPENDLLQDLGDVEVAVAIEETKCRCRSETSMRAWRSRTQDPCERQNGPGGWRTGGTHGMFSFSVRWIGATVGTRRGRANGGWERKSGGRRTGACHMWQDTCGYTMRSEGGPENRLGHRNGPSNVRRGRGSIRRVNATAAGASAACARRLSSVPKIDWGAEMDPTMRAQVRNARRGRGSERWVSTVAVGACGAHRGHPEEPRGSKMEPARRAQCLEEGLGDLQSAWPCARAGGMSGASRGSERWRRGSGGRDGRAGGGNLMHATWCTRVLRNAGSTLSPRIIFGAVAVMGGH